MRALRPHMARMGMAPALGARSAGGGAAAVMFTSSDQRLFINNVAGDITTDNVGEVFADGGSIGSTSGTPPTLSHTFTSVDNDISVTTADDAHRHACVAADNASLHNISGYTKTNVTVTSGQSDPDGGSNAYKVEANTGGGAKTYRFYGSATGTPATANSGVEIWVSPFGTLLPVIRVYPLNWYGECNPATGEALGQISAPNCIGSVTVVETREVSGRTWYRLWARGEFGTALNSLLFIDFLGDFLTASVDVASGSHGFYIYKPRYVDGILPIYDYQRYMLRDPGTVSGVEEWDTYTPYDDGTAAQHCKVLVPDTYDPDRTEPYKICVMAPVEAVPGSSYTDELLEVLAGDYHNTYDCIFAGYRSTTGSVPWGGIKNDGKYDHARILRSIPDSLRQVGFNVSTDREDRFIAGYSKGGWAAYASMLVSDTFGYAAAWDAPWTSDYTALSSGAGANLQFGNEATFLLYQPYTILSANKANVNDKTRLVISQGSTWGSEHAGMKTLMDGESVTYEEVTGLTGVTHDADTAWMDDVLAAMFGLAA